MPASSQCTTRSVSGCRAADASGTSVSVSTTKVGTVRSVRIRDGFGIHRVSASSPLIGAPTALLLWIMKPS